MSFETSKTTVVWENSVLLKCRKINIRGVLIS